MLLMSPHLPHKHVPDSHERLGILGYNLRAIRFMFEHNMFLKEIKVFEQFVAGGEPTAHFVVFLFLAMDLHAFCQRLCI